LDQHLAAEEVEELQEELLVEVEVEVGVLAGNPYLQ